MIPVGQPYRAAGPVNVRSILTTLILGTATAFLAALAVWLWEISPIPTFVFITMTLQGVLIGLVMRFMVGRLRMRNPKLVSSIAFACGLASAAMVHYGHHLQLSSQIAKSLRAQVEKDPTFPPEEKREILAKLANDPQATVDRLLMAKTGHKGLIGSLILRNQIGITLKGSKTTGWLLWLLWGSEALFAATVAAAIAGERAGKPFCEECETWCHEEPDRHILAGTAARPLVEAVQSDDTSQVVDLDRRTPAGESDAHTGANVYTCPGCAQAFADVWYRTYSMKRGKKEAKTKTLVGRLRISPRMAELLRNQQLLATRLTPEPQHGGDVGVS